MNSRHLSKNKRAFTLLETIMAMMITAILLAVFYSIFHLSVKTYQEASSTEDLYYQGAHVLDYIASEVQAAERIIPMEETGISDHEFFLGFLLCSKAKENTPISYHYIYYVFSGHTISRKACTSYIQDVSKLRASQFTKNKLCENVKNIHQTAFYDDRIDLKIELEINGKTKMLETSISTYLKENQ